MPRKRDTTTVVIRETGLRFEYGESISPTWDDLYIAMKHLYTGGWAEKLMPENVPAEFAISGNQEQIHALVPLILTELDRAIDRGNIILTAKLRVVAYIIAWYWHIHLGGPRPVISKMSRLPRRVYAPVPELDCPWCGHEYTKPKRYKRASAIFRHWHNWLERHASEYHKWEV